MVNEGVLEFSVVEGNRGVAVLRWGVLVVLASGDCDCIGDGIGVVGFESELGSRIVGLEGVGDTGVLTFGDVSGDCTSEKKDKCSIFVVLYYQIVIIICK